LKKFLKTITKEFGNLRKWTHEIISMLSIDYGKWKSNMEAAVNNFPGQIPT